MTLCTLALGEKHLRLAERLRKSLPAEIKVCTELPRDIPARKNDHQYDHHNKVFLLEQECDEGGTLYLDADAICVDEPAFLSFLRHLNTLPAGIYSPYVFSAYGFHYPRITEPKIDRERLTVVLRSIDSVTPLSEAALLDFVMPLEWMMFFRFASSAQRVAFFVRFRQLHALLIESTCTLGKDCNLIGLAAQHCGLPVIRLRGGTGMRHKE